MDLLGKLVGALDKLHFQTLVCRENLALHDFFFDHIEYKNFGHFFRETAQSVQRVFGHVDKSKGLSLYSSLPMPEL